MDDPLLDEKVERIAGEFEAATIPHAFGGALALAYYGVPRATTDIDINVFESPKESGACVALLARMGAVGAADSSETQLLLQWGQHSDSRLLLLRPFS